MFVPFLVLPFLVMSRVLIRQCGACALACVIAIHLFLTVLPYIRAVIVTALAIMLSWYETLMP